MLVISIGERKLGLVVDSLHGEEELVIKALDDQSVATDLISGASILGDGRVVLIVNVPAIVDRHSKGMSEQDDGVVSGILLSRADRKVSRGSRRGAPMTPVRVLVVDDSALMRKLIPQILQTDSSIEVVGTAMDGNFGLRKIEELKPQVVTLDLEMPGMGGIDMLKEIMRRHRLPVIVVSSHSTQGASVTMQALSLGAFDFVAKPVDVSARMPQIASELIGKIKAAAQSRGVQVRTMDEGSRSGSKAPLDAKRDPDQSDRHRRLNRRTSGSAICILTIAGGFSRHHHRGSTYAGRFHRNVCPAPGRNLRHLRQGSAIRRRSAGGPRPDLSGKPAY